MSPRAWPSVVDRLRDAGLAPRVLGELIGLRDAPRPGAAVRCPRGERHRNGDRHPSLVVAKDGASAECRVCGFGAGGLLALAVEVRGLDGSAAAAAELERRYFGAPELQPEPAQAPGRFQQVVEDARIYFRDRRDDADVRDLLARYDGTPEALAAIGGGVLPDERGEPARLVLPLFAPAGGVVGAKVRPGRHSKEEDLPGSRGGVLGEVVRLAREPDAPVLLLEGGHDLLAVVAADVARDHVRLALPGALRFDAEWSRALRGRDVVLALHDDRAGAEGMERATRDLRAAGAAVRLLEWDAVLADLDGAKDVADALRAGRRDALASAVRDAPGLLRWRGVEDLAEEAAEGVPWIVEGLLARGAVTLLSGHPKAGKSTFVFAILRALERGEPFAGFATAAGPAVVLSEEGPATIHEKASRFGLRDTRFLTRREMHPEFSLRDFLLEGVREARRIRAVLLCIDTLTAWGRFGRDAEKDAGAMQDALGAVLDAAGEDLAVLLIHHLRKSDAEEGQGARGSSAIAGAMDVVLELRRAKEMPSDTFRSLQAYSRFRETPLDEQILELRGASVLRQGGAAEVRAAAASERTLDHLRATREPATRDEVCAGIGGKRECTARALKALLSRGAIVRTGTGKPGSPYRYAVASGELVPPVPVPSPDPGTGVPSSRPSLEEGREDTGGAEGRVSRPSRRGWEEILFAGTAAAGPTADEEPRMTGCGG